MKFMGTKQQGKKAHKSARSKPHDMVHDARIREPAGKRRKYAQAHLVHSFPSELRCQGKAPKKKKKQKKNIILSTA